MFDPIKHVFCATDTALPVSPTPPQPKCLRGRINSLFLRTTSTGRIAHNRRTLDRRGASVIVRTAQISITHTGGFDARPSHETQGFTEQFAVCCKNGAWRIWRDSS